jgi:hypothetical protein
MTPKTPDTATKPPTRGQKTSEAAAEEFAARWAEARQAYPLYATLATQFNLAPLPYPMGELPPQRPTRDVFDSDLQWLDAIDEKVRAFQIRQLPSEILNSSEEALRSFTQRQLRKADKTAADRDKIDLLLVARVLQTVLTEADSTPLEWCEPLEKILETLDHCHSLRDLMEHGLLEQGRLVKESAGPMFYDPAALVAFCRFNFSLRRAFIRMLHADWTAVQQAVDALEAGGVKSVDCRRAGFSAAETTMQLRAWCENWRQPFHKDYTESSVSHAFEQLLALRADLEEALGHSRPEMLSAVVPTPQRRPSAPAVEAKKASAEQAPPPAAAVQVSPPMPKKAETSAVLSDRTPQATAVSPSANKPAKSAADGPTQPTAAAETEKCLEAIWEQLIAAPPSRGRSMSTVVLHDTKVLLSSWEVAAFVVEGGQEAEYLRRAVVARALLAVAGDQRKRSGDESALASALVHARSEVSYFQGRVEQAKRAKNTEAAVNLGISTKRLLSFIEESEKLQP